MYWQIEIDFYKLPFLLDKVKGNLLMNKSGLYLKNIVLEYSLQFYRCMFIPKCLHKLYSSMLGSSLATTKNYYDKPSYKGLST